MEILSAIAIAQAAIKGIQSAAEAWPYVYAVFTQGHVLTPNEQAIVDRGADDAHAALQLARTPQEAAAASVASIPAEHLPKLTDATFHGEGSTAPAPAPAA